MGTKHHPIADQLRQFLCPGCSDQEIWDLLAEAQITRPSSLALDPNLINYIKLSVIHQQLGYVLFGSKPCAYGLVISDTNASKIKNRTRPTNSELNSMLDYLSLNNPNPDLITRKLKDSSAGESQLTAVLTFWKSKVHAVVLENIDLFKDKLGRDFTADNMVNRLTTSESVDQLFSPFTFNECEHLFGIILGYGRDSSLAWQEYQKENKETDLNLQSVSIPDGHIVSPVLLKFIETKEAKSVIERFNSERIGIEEIIKSGNLIIKAIEVLCP